MVLKALDYKYLLIDNYKSMNISEETLATIFVIDQLINDGNYFITGDLLSLKMSLDPKKIDAILADLLTRGFIEYKSSGKKTITSLKPLQKKLTKDFERTMDIEDANESNENISLKVKTIVEFFENKLDRKILPIEVSKIKEWVICGYKQESIEEALKDCISRKTKSFKDVDKLLLSWASRNDIETDGITSISPEWRKSLKETIEIAKTPWLNDDNDK